MKENKEVYEDPKNMREVLNNNFLSLQQNLTLKINKVKREKIEMSEIWISRDEIKAIIRNWMDERKVIEADGLSGYILKECR